MVPLIVCLVAAQVTAQIIHKAKDNAEGGKDADLRAAMRRLNCPKPSAINKAGLTDQKKVNLFGRVFDYTQIFDPRRRPLAYTSLRTDGVLAYVPFGKRGAARAHRGQGARGRGGGGEGWFFCFLAHVGLIEATAH